MSGTHAILAPSSADVWVKCSGSVTLGALYPQEDTDATREGEAAHWVVSTCLDSYQQPDTLVLSSQLLGTEAPNGVIITDEMIDAADVMIDAVLELCQADGLLRSMRVEEWVPIHKIHAENAGTPDLWIWDEKTLHLHVWDFKYGHGGVSAEENWQCIDYAAGILDKLGIDGHTEQMVKVTIYVVQPRCYDGNGSIKTWTIPAIELRPYFNKLEAAANEALGPNPICRSGTHCKYCPAIHACVSARQSAHAVVDFVHSAVPDDLTDAGLSFELQLLEAAKGALENRLKAAQAESMARLSRGNIINGYGVEQGKGNRKFDAPIDELQMLGDLIGIKLLDDPKPITPAEFDKRLKKINKDRATPIDPSVINSYISTPATGTKLVKVADSKAHKVFGRSK